MSSSAHFSLLPSEHEPIHGRSPERCRRRDPQRCGLLAARCIARFRRQDPTSQLALVCRRWANSSRRRGQVSLHRNHRVARGATPLIKTGSCLKKDRSGDTCPRRYRAAMLVSWPIWLSILERASATKCGCRSFFVRHDRTLPACVLKAKLRHRPKRLTEGLPRLQPLLKGNSCDSPVVWFCCTARQIRMGDRDIAHARNLYIGFEISSEPLYRAR